MHIMYGNDLRGGGGERERRGKGMGRDWGEEGEEKEGDGRGVEGRQREMGRGVHDVEWWMW